MDKRLRKVVKIESVTITEGPIGLGPKDTYPVIWVRHGSDPGRNLSLGFNNGGKETHLYNLYGSDLVDLGRLFVELGTILKTGMIPGLYREEKNS